LGITVRFVSPVMFPVISPDSDVTGVTSIASEPGGLIQQSCHFTLQIWGFEVSWW